MARRAPRRGLSAAWREWSKTEAGRTFLAEQRDLRHRMERERRALIEAGVFPSAILPWPWKDADISTIEIPLEPRGDCGVE